MADIRADLDFRDIQQQSVLLKCRNAILTVAVEHGSWAHLPACLLQGYGAVSDERNRQFRDFLTLRENTWTCGVFKRLNLFKIERLSILMDDYEEHSSSCV